MLLVYIQPIPFITSKRIHEVAHADVEWMQPIANYLHAGEVSEDRKQAQMLRIQDAWFTLIYDQLYRWSFRGLYLKFLIDSKAQYVLIKLYEGVCVNHLGGRTLAHRAYSQGYY